MDLREADRGGKKAATSFDERTKGYFLDFPSHFRPSHLAHRQRDSEM